MLRRVGGLGVNFAQGFGEGAFEDLTGVKPNTGKPSAGGVIGNAAYQMLKQKQPGPPPRTPAMAQMRFQALGFGSDQSAAIGNSDWMKINNSSMQRMQSSGVLESNDIGLFQRNSFLNPLRPR
jgi:hypothetical protein